MTAIRQQRGSLTAGSIEYLDRAKATIDGLRAYWPLTLRQIYYQLVADGSIENHRNQYQKLSRVLSQARLDGLVEWESIEDRSRRVLSSAGWSDSREFILGELGDFLCGYRRDLVQSQEVALELWIEKDALSRICHDVAFEYFVPVVVARGFSSVSYAHECRNRILRNRAVGKVTRLLYFGDLDPSGWAMLPAILHTLQDEMGLGNSVEGVRCALNPEQVEEHNLPRSVDAIKDSDSRARKYRERFGDLAVELDALRPALLERLVRQAIEERIDLALVEEERAREAGEAERIDRLQARVHDLVLSSLQEDDL